MTERFTKPTTQQTFELQKVDGLPTVEDITYQWYRDDKPIRGATQASYTTKAADYDTRGKLKSITCHVAGDTELDSGIKQLSEIFTVVVKPLK